MNFIIKYVIITLQFVLNTFGFETLKDAENSMFSILHNKHSILTILSLASFIELYNDFSFNYIGIEGGVSFGLIVLFIGEFFTGVWVNLFNLTTKKIEWSKFDWVKFLRLPVKIWVYGAMLGIINSYKTSNLSMYFFGMEFNFFEWVHFILLVFLSMQMIINVLKNLYDAGWKELAPIIRIFDRKMKSIEDSMGDSSINDKKDEN